MESIYSSTVVYCDNITVIVVEFYSLLFTSLYEEYW